MAEAQVAAAPEQDLLAVQEELGLAFEGYVRAVGARVDQRELVAAAFDARVLARGAFVLDDDVVVLLASHRDYGGERVHAPLDVAVPELELGRGLHEGPRR